MYKIRPNTKQFLDYLNVHSFMAKLIESLVLFDLKQCNS